MWIKLSKNNKKTLIKTMFWAIVSFFLAFQSPKMYHNLNPVETQ